MDKLILKDYLYARTTSETSLYWYIWQHLKPVLFSGMIRHPLIPVFTSSMYRHLKQGINYMHV